MMFMVSCALSFAQINKPGSGNCLYFDGIPGNNGVNCGGSNVLNPGAGSITCAAWVKIDNIPSGTFYPIIRKADGLFDNGYLLDIRPNGVLRFQVDTLNGPNFAVASTPGVMKTGQWQYVVGMLDRTANLLKVYVDGIEVGSTTGPGTGSITPSANCIIGHWQTSNNSNKNFFGSVDEIRVWNKALTQSEIRATMCKKLVGNEPNLVGYWRIDEGINGTCSGGSDVCDATGNGNDGTIF